MTVDPFIEAEEAAGHGAKRACRLLEVSRSAYYERKKAIPSARNVTDAELTEKINEVHDESNGTYGYLRVRKALADEGVEVGKWRVRRLMRAAGLEGRAKKRWRTTTVADPEAEAAKDLIQRHFGPCEELDRRYVGDITYVATWEGWAYLATVIDLASRRVVGWALADHMRTELVEEALEMAFVQRRPPEGVIFHSDRGCQGGFQWSSQHLDDGGVRGWELPGSRRRRGRCGESCTRRVGPRSGSGIRFGGSGSGSRRDCRVRKQRCRWECHPPLGVGGSVRLAGCDLSASPHCLAVTCPSPSVRRSPSSRRKAAV